MGNDNVVRSTLLTKPDSSGTREIIVFPGEETQAGGTVFGFHDQTGINFYPWALKLTDRQKRALELDVEAFLKFENNPQERPSVER